MVALPAQALQYHQDEEDHLQKNIIFLTVHEIAVLLIVIWVQSFIPIDRKLRVTAQKLLCYTLWRTEKGLMLKTSLTSKAQYSGYLYQLQVVD